MNEYKIIKVEDDSNIQPWQLYVNGMLINNYTDEDNAKKVMGKLEELDKLKMAAPELKVLDTLEKFIKSI